MRISYLLSRLGIPAAVVGMALIGGSPAFATSTWTTLHNFGPTSKGFTLWDCGVDGCQFEGDITASVGGTWQVTWTGNQNGTGLDAELSGSTPICQQGIVYSAAPAPLQAAPVVAWSDDPYNSLPPAGAFGINEYNGGCFLNGSYQYVEEGYSYNTSPPQGVNYQDLKATGQLQFSCPDAGQCEADDGEMYLNYNW